MPRLHSFCYNLPLWQEALKSTNEQALQAKNSTPGQVPLLLNAHPRYYENTEDGAKDLLHRGNHCSVIALFKA